MTAVRPFAAVSLACLAGLGACQSDDDRSSGASSNDERASFALTIGTLPPLSGPVSSLEPAAEKAGVTAETMLTRALEQAGSKVTVEINQADPGAEPQTAIAAARELVASGAQCIAGPWLSAQTIAVNNAVASPQRIPVLAIGSSPEINTLANREYLFRPVASDDVQGKALADLIEERLGGASGKTVSVAGRNDAYGEGVANAFADAWKERGGEVQGPELYDPTQGSFDTTASSVVQGDPDAVLIADFPDPYGKVGAALVRTGDFDAKKLFVTDGLSSSAGIPEGVPAAALSGATGTLQVTQGPNVDAYRSAFADLPGTKKHGNFDYNAFDATILCGLAAVAAGSDDPAAIAEQVRGVASPPGKQYGPGELAGAIEALEAGDDIDYQGASGTVDLGESGDEVGGSYSIYQYEGNEYRSLDQKITVGTE